MNKKEKIIKIIKGEHSESIAASFWRHFYNAENNITHLADALIGFQNKYNWDFIKINPRASYHIEDWNCRYDYSKSGKPVRITYPIKQPSDWRKLFPLDIEKGVLAEHVKLVHLMKEAFGDEVPALQTIFLPAEIAARLCGNRLLFRQHIREAPQHIEYAMNIIVNTFIEYAKRCIDAGSDGFFLATKCASFDYLNDHEFKQWHKHYDEKFLHGIEGTGKIFILHFCGKNIRINEMMNYPVDILHWDSTIAGNPALHKIQSQTNKTVMGGISNEYMHELSLNENLALINNITLAKRWILGAECVLEAPYKEEILETISEMIKL